ncbi:RFIP5 protein, partial [Climacteris rufus]|nr:RFIP5 protein [Climacteris rufus]
RWHKLHSKAGKKEKERGEILVSIQFTRNSLTASMFDLSAKDKPRSPFGKLKDKVTGKKKYDLESASAIIPSSVAALDMEEDYELGGKKSKVKGFFLKNKLRKSSLSQSNTSLGSDSTISSASLSLAATAPEVTKSPSRHSSLSTEHSGKDVLPSPTPTHKRAFSDDVSRLSPAPEPRAAPSPKPKLEPASRSSLCINGSHVYGEEAALAAPLGVPLGVPPSSAPLGAPPASAPLPVPGGPRRPDEPSAFTPLQPEPHEAPWGLGSLDRAQQRDEPRFIPSPPSLALQEELKVSTKAVTLSNHLGRARMEESGRLEGKPTQAAAPLVFCTEPAQDRQHEDGRKEDKRAKGGFFHHGGARNEAGSGGQGDTGSPGRGAAEERSKNSGWFGSREPRESPQKPSLEVSPQVETSSDAPSHFAPRSPAPCPAARPASMPSSNLPPAPGDSQAGCLSPTNPFLNSLQSNPFFEDLLAEQVLNSPSPTHFLSSFPPGPHAAAELPPADAVPSPLSEWDETFDAFATSRLQPEQRKENFFASVSAEGMAFIDEADAASPAERAAEPPGQQGTKGFEQAESPVGAEIPAALRSWTNFSSLDVGANLVSTTQEATVIEDVLSPVSAGSVARRRKSSTPMVWAAARGSSEPSSAPTPGADATEGRSESPVSEGAGAAAAHSAADVETGTSELEGGDTSLGEHPSEMNETDAAKQFETCTSKFSLDGLDQLGAEESWSQPRLSPPLGTTDSAKWDMASKQEPFSEKLSISGLNPPSEPDPGQPELFWTALEEQEAAGHPNPQSQRSERGESPSPLEPVWDDGEGRAGEQPQEAEQGRARAGERSAESRIDCKQADFWKPDRPEQRHRQGGASALRNPFTLALSPNSPSNPFVETPPAPLPVAAALPETLAQGELSFCSPREAALGRGLRPTNAPPSPHASQPPAFSTPFLVAATNPEPRGPAGVPASRRAAARPCPQPRDAQASALLVLPRETQPAEKPFCQQTTSPHPVKPLSAGQEGSRERRQQHRSSLSSALSNGLERLRTATTGSVQPLGPASHPDRTDSKLKQDPSLLDQSAKYYHLTHDELIQLVLQKELELSKKEEHIQELENYIDQLLVRIMEQSPTLLQIPLGGGKAQ